MTLPYVTRGTVAYVMMDAIYGSLIIDHGSIRFEPTPRVNRWFSANSFEPIVHTDVEVRVTRARLLPPNMNSALVLQDHSTPGRRGSARVDLSAWYRRQVTAALQCAGFVVVERVAWWSRRPRE